MPLQLKRVLSLLVGLIIVFLVIRRLLIPDSFGKLGHYRANSLAENEAQVPKYIGSDDCHYCHETEALLLAEGLHSTIACETCHGPGHKHIESNEVSDIIKPSGRDFCGRCHEKNAARPDDIIKQVDISTHHIEENSCTNCHNAHEPWK